MSATGRILVVEDDDILRRELLAWLGKPLEPRLQAECGVQGLDVQEAASGTEADRKLDEAARRLRPFDVMVLDLKLPPAPGGPPSADVGYRLAGRVVKDGRSSELVVIQSIFHDDIAVVRKALELGVANFFGKPGEGTYGEFLDRVMLVYQKARARQRARWLELRRRRAEGWLLTRAAAHVADRLARDFSRSLGRILDNVAELRQALYDHDPTLQAREHDPLRKALEALSRSAIEAADTCYDRRREHSPDAGRLEAVPLEELAGQGIERLRDGIVYKRLDLAAPPPGQHRVNASPDEVRLALEELLFNAVNVSGEGMAIEVGIEAPEEHAPAGIRVVDHGPLLDAETCRRITSGVPDDEAHRRLARREFNSPEEECALERRCSLSLAQQAARDAGAWIEVQSDQGRNTATLFVPSPLHVATGQP